jgi:hypothetical protein
LSRLFLDFGMETIGSSSPTKAVTLTNVGATALVIDSFAITGSASEDFIETNNCPASLAANAQCTIDVAFEPTAKGFRSATLVIVDNARNSSQRIVLSGRGD